MKRWVLAPVCAVVLLAGGCSGDDPADVPDSLASSSTPSAAESRPPPESRSTAGTDPVDELEAAVQEYSDAFLTGDADTAYGLLTERCRDRIGEQVFADVVAQAAVEYGSALPMESFDAELNGEQARVTYTYAVAAINQTQEPWALEDGAWHNDDC